MALPETVVVKPGRYWDVSWNPVTGEACHPERLEQPLHWRKSRRVLVGDLFADGIPDEFIDKVLDVIWATPRHTFLMPTKRPHRFPGYFSRWQGPTVKNGGYASEVRLPDNLWLGVSVSTQADADERIPLLLQTPAAVRWVSVEPMLAAVWLDKWLLPTFPQITPSQVRCLGWKPPIDWVVVGGETGPGARPLDDDWVRGLRDQCQAAGVPFYLKQLGEWREACAPDDEIWAGHPPNLRHEHGTYFIRVGKRAAGRLLDGVEWNEMPEGRP